MKITLQLSLSLIVFSGLISSAQIGVNTNSPTANLDVNGTLRVRSLEKTPNGFQANGNVLYIMGVDVEGNVIPIEIGENIILQDNKLQVQLPEVETTPSELPNGSTLEDNYSPTEPDLINDLDLGIVILPGDPRGTRPVVRLSNGANTNAVEITGIKAVEDGTMAYLYPTSGDIKLLKEDIKSQPENRILLDGSYIAVKQYQMVLLMYDATLQRWVVAGTSN